MALLESISRWRPWRRQASLDAIPFEELQNRYAQDPTGVYQEFTRRLHRLVFYAAEAYMARSQPGATQAEIEDKVIRVFEEFGPQFGNGEPATILLRFANVVRNVLDDYAFRVIAMHFYQQLPTYHIADAQERRFLGAAYQEALSAGGGDLDEALAKRFDVTLNETQAILQRANRDLQKVIKNEFSIEELKDLTEGYLP